MSGRLTLAELLKLQKEGKLTQNMLPQERKIRPGEDGSLSAGEAEKSNLTKTEPEEKPEEKEFNEEEEEKSEESSLSSGTEKSNTETEETSTETIESSGESTEEEKIDAPKAEDKEDKEDDDISGSNEEKEEDEYSTTSEDEEFVKDIQSFDIKKETEQMQQTDALNEQSDSYSTSSEAESDHEENSCEDDTENEQQTETKLPTTDAKKKPTLAELLQMKKNSKLHQEQMVSSSEDSYETESEESDSNPDTEVTANNNTSITNSVNNNSSNNNSSMSNNTSEYSSSLNTSRSPRHKMTLMDLLKQQKEGKLNQAEMNSDSSSSEEENESKKLSSLPNKEQNNEEKKNVKNGDSQKEGFKQGTKSASNTPRISVVRIGHSIDSNALYNDTKKSSTFTSTANKAPVAPPRLTLVQLLALQKQGKLTKDMLTKDEIKPGTDGSLGRSSIAVMASKSDIKDKQIQQSQLALNKEKQENNNGGEKKKLSLSELIRLQKEGKLRDDMLTRDYIIPGTDGSITTRARINTEKEKESFINRDLTQIEKIIVKFSETIPSIIKAENLYYSKREIGVLQSLIEFIMKKSPEILTKMFSNRDKAEELADAVLSLAYSKRLAMNFVGQMLREEFATHSDSRSLFRENTSATRVTKSFLAKVGRKYLLKYCKPFVLDIIKSKQSFEIDDHREMDTEVREKNKEALMATCRKLFDLIIDTFDNLPAGLKLLARVFYEYATEYFGQLSDDARNNLTGSFLILRYVNPAIFTPEKYGIVEDQKEISTVARRNLILVSKVLQNLSNGVMFMAEKEPYMLPLNELLKEYMDKFKGYFKRIVDLAKNFSMVLVVEDVSITDIKPIALLHKELCDRAEEIVGTSNPEISNEFCKYMVSLGNYSTKTVSLAEFLEPEQIKLKEYLEKNNEENVYCSMFTMNEKKGRVEYILVVTLYDILLLTKDCVLCKKIHCYDIATVKSENMMTLTLLTKDNVEYVGETMHPDHIIMGMIRAFKSCFSKGRCQFRIDVPTHRAETYTSVISLQTFESCGGFLGIYKAQCTHMGVPINETVEMSVDGLDSLKDEERKREINTTNYITQDSKNESEFLTGYEIKPILLALEENTWFNKLVIKECDLSVCKDELVSLFNRNNIINNVSLVDVKLKKGMKELFDNYYHRNVKHLIRKLDVSYNNLDIDTIKLLCKIVHECNIEELNLDGCFIKDDKQLFTFIDSLKGNPTTTLKVLNLSNSKVSSASVAALKTHLAAEFPSLKKLIMSNIVVKDGSVVNCVKGLNELEVLDFSGIDLMKTTDCAELGRLSETLKELILTNANITPEILRLITQSVKCPGFSLNLEGVNLTEEGITILTKELFELKTVKSLNISNTPIKDKGLKLIFDALLKNTSIEQLNVSNIINGDDKENLVPAMIKFFKRNTTVKECIMRGGKTLETRLGGNMIPLIIAMTQSDKLQVLDIESQGMGNKGVFALANLIKITKTMKVLKIDENSIDLNGIHALVDAMRNNKTIVELQLPILDCRKLRMENKFNGGNKLISEIVQCVQNNAQQQQ